MKFYKRAVVLKTITILIILLCFSTVTYAENTAKFYFIYRNSYEDNNAKMELGAQQILYNNVLDSVNLDNLEIMPLDVATHYSFSSEGSDLHSFTIAVRKYLLSNGYARLVNFEIASESERQFQERAQKKELGFWASNMTMPALAKMRSPRKTIRNPNPSPISSGGNDKSEAEEKTAPAWLEAVIAFFVRWGSYIVSILAGCGFLSYLVRFLIRKLRTRKKKIYLGGGNATGKSTLLLYLLNPEASNADLLLQVPTLTVKKERIIRDDIELNKKFTIQVALLDPPGHELEHAIDQLMLTWRKKILKSQNIIILVVAPTKENAVRNDIDQTYIEDQLKSISIFWSALIKAKKTIKPESVVMFINKLDLYDEVSEVSKLFDRHKKLLGDICRESQVPFYCIPGSVLDKSGMTKLMKVIKGRKLTQYDNRIYNRAGRRMPE